MLLGLGDICHSFDCVLIAVSSKLYAFHSLPRMEYGGPAILPSIITEMVHLESLKRYGKRLVDGFREIS